MRALTSLKSKLEPKRLKEKISVLAMITKAKFSHKPVTNDILANAEKPKSTIPVLFRRAITAAGAAFLALGAVGLLIFGYLIFTSGGFTALTGMASGIGLLVSLVVLLTGIYMK